MPPQRSERPERFTPPDSLRCKYSQCATPIGRWDKHLRFSEEQAESWGSGENRVGRLVTTDAGVVCDWACLVGYAAELHSTLVVVAQPVS